MLYKRGQTELSFGMIFSVIMIIGILSFGGYVVWKFLSVNECTESANFISIFQKDIDKIYYGTGGSYTPANGYPLSSSKKMLCIIDTSSSARGENADLYEDVEAIGRTRYPLVIYPFEISGCNKYPLKNIDLQKSTAENNPLCFDNKNGKIKITMTKNYGESLVTLS